MNLTDNEVIEGDLEAILKGISQEKEFFLGLQNPCYWMRWFSWVLFDAVFCKIPKGIWD